MIIWFQRMSRNYQFIHAQTAQNWNSHAIYRIQLDSSEFEPGYPSTAISTLRKTKKEKLYMKDKVWVSNYLSIFWCAMHNPSEQHATESRVERRNGKILKMYSDIISTCISARRKSMGKMRKLVCIGQGRSAEKILIHNPSTTIDLTVVTKWLESIHMWHFWIFEEI